MSASETSLSLLILAGTTDDVDAWQRLTEIYSPLISVWLRDLGLQSADADDLVQEILIVLNRELPTFAHNGRAGAFRAWLRQMMVNRVRNFRRSQKYRPAVVGGSAWAASLDELADDSSDASREWNQEHDRRVMERLLMQIRPRYESKTWEAFYRQVFGGQRADQVATVMGMPISSVYVARSRILSALRNEAAGLVSE